MVVLLSADDGRKKKKMYKIRKNKNKNGERKINVIENQREERGTKTRETDPPRIGIVSVPRSGQVQGGGKGLGHSAPYVYEPRRALRLRMLKKYFRQ